MVNGLLIYRLSNGLVNRLYRLGNRLINRLNGLCHRLLIYGLDRLSYRCGSCCNYGCRRGCGSCCLRRLNLRSCYGCSTVGAK